MGHFKQVSTETQEEEEARLLAESQALDAIYADLAATAAKQNAEWVAKWPNHCKHCGGWGIHSWTENQSPLGSGHYWPMDMSEPCDYCYAQGKCGRCGAELAVGEDSEPTVPCSYCGWEDGKDGLQSTTP